MKKIILLLCFLLSISIFSQKQITLEEAIKIAQKKSPDYKTLLNQNQASYWRFRNYQAGFLPQLRLDATLPEYRNSVNRITLDNGQEDFRRSNLSRLDGTLSLNQNIALTGGTISLSTQFERVDAFGDMSSTRFAVIPFSISYRQNSLFYNRFKWDRKIEPLIYEEAKRAFIENMEQISFNTSIRYFALLKPRSLVLPIIAKGTPLPPCSLYNLLFSSDLFTSNSHQATRSLSNNTLAF